MQPGVGGVADHHAGGLEAGGCHAADAAAFHQRAHLAAEFELLGAHLVKAVVLCLVHHFLQARQRIRGHGGVVHVGTGLIGFHDLQPLFEIAGEAAAGGGVNGGAGALAEHDHGAAG